jgi:hypothetical protein
LEENLGNASEDFNRTGREEVLQQTLQTMPDSGKTAELRVKMMAKTNKLKELLE